MNREEKKRNKRAEIVENSLFLFNENGYENTTTAEIAASCHIAKKTLFQYFHNKEDIIFENENELLEEILQTISEKGNDWLALTHWLTQFNHERRDFTLPKLIQETPVLYQRLLQMWSTYEKEISCCLGNTLADQILAARIVLVLRLSFEHGYSMEEILKALQ